MKNYLGQEFDGIISGVASFGFFVETVEHKCEGMVTVRDLGSYDDFRLDEADYALVGMRTKQKFRMGDLVKIKVVAANLSKRQLDYEWVPVKKGVGNLPAGRQGLELGKKDIPVQKHKSTKPGKKKK